MLREIDLAPLSKNHVVLDLVNKRAAFTIRVRKTDQAAAKVTRMLQCLCRETCCTGCPFRISTRFFAKMDKENLKCHSEGQESNQSAVGQRMEKARWSRDLRPFCAQDRGIEVHPSWAGNTSGGLFGPVEVGSDQ